VKQASCGSDATPVRRRRRAIAVGVCLTIAAMGASLAQPPAEDPVIRPGQFVQGGASAQQTSPVDFETEEPFSGTYVGADIATVVNQILGEFLNIDYSIAPDVSGMVTLRIEEVRSRLAAIDALRTALKPMGIAVIDRGDFVAVARGGDQSAPVQAAVITPGQPSPAGGGVVVLTPRFISPGQLGPLVSPFAPSATIVQTDDRRRFLLVRGDEASISAISNAAAMFDVDWFAQVSVATFGLQHTTPDGMIAEL
jgi:general secretion pathway protein D